MCNHSPFKRWQRFTLTTCLTLSLVGCATSKNPNDPWEGYNRAIFKFNEQVDKVVFKPAATIYNKIIPAPISKGVGNVYANIKLPLTIVNDLLQLNPKQAVADTWRFGINSTFGFGGFFDVAEGWGLEHNKQDFGLTLAKWGVWKNSSYLVAPFYGPTTIRDSVTMPLNLLFTPWPYLRPAELNLGLYALDVVDTRAGLLKSDELVERVAVDEYAFVRDAFLQYRQNQIDPSVMAETSEEDLERAFEGEF